jgi:hypothetical protein
LNTCLPKFGITLPYEMTEESLNQEYLERPKGTEMTRQVVAVLYVAAMVAVIVGVDIGFFRNRFWERLLANIGIVLVVRGFLPEIP